MRFSISYYSLEESLIIIKQIKWRGGNINVQRWFVSMNPKAFFDLEVKITTPMRKHFEIIEARPMFLAGKHQMIHDSTRLAFHWVSSAC